MWTGKTTKTGVKIFIDYSVLNQVDTTILDNPCEYCGEQSLHYSPAVWYSAPLRDHPEEVYCSECYSEYLYEEFIRR